MTGGTMKPQAPRLWTVADVAAFLGVSKSLVYRETAADRMPCHRIFGNRLRFDPEEIKAFVREGRALLSDAA